MSSQQTEFEEHLEEHVEVSRENLTAGTSQRSRRSKRKKSEVWNHFTKIQISENVYKDVHCDHCGKKLSWDNNLGTSHLNKHLNGPCPNFCLNDSSSSTYRSPRSEYKFDPGKSRRDLAMACIKHNYPFNIANHDYFEKFLNGLNPDFRLPTRNTIRADVIEIFEEEKIRIYSLLDNLKCKVSLTTDMWTSDHSNKAYCSLTAHYIDDSWELKKKILAFKLLEYPHDGEKLFHFMKDRILEWNLDRKLSSVVVDNATANTSMIDKLKSWLVSDDLIPFFGALLHVRCSAHILNLIVQDGLRQIRQLLDDIRNTVKYLGRTPSAMQKFEKVKQQCKLQDKRAVADDVPTRWNSTFELLDTALPLREAFARLALIDRHYVYNPPVEEWDTAAIVVECLRTFYEATNLFSGSKYPTCNVFFPTVCTIHLKLLEWEKSEHECLRAMCAPMKEKFDKYWDECSLVLAIGVVFDPRYKMHVVKYFYNLIYGVDGAASHIDRVQNMLDQLYTSYGGSTASASSCAGVSSRSLAGVQSGFLRGFNTWYDESNSSSLQQSELETYLNEPKLPQDDKFNVLNWWSINDTRLPVLQKIARDILAVPATTVASESAFSVCGRIIDETRSKLSSDAVEALVVANDWIPSLKENVHRRLSSLPRDEVLGTISEGDENELRRPKKKMT